MAKKCKILFVNDEMVMGGVARVLNTLIKNLDAQKYEIDLLVLHPHGELLQDVPKHVKIIAGSAFFEPVDLPLNEVLASWNLRMIYKKLRLLCLMKSGLIKNKIKKERQRMLTQQYDVEIAAKEGFCTIFTACGNSKKKINWVLTDYSVCNYSVNHMKLMKSILPDIDLNIADSMQALQAYEQVFDIQIPGVAIHNLMDDTKVKNGILEPSSLDETKLNVICVARFHPQKAMLRLIKAHEYAINQGIDHHLHLIGSGEEEKMCKDYVNEHRLNQVHFLGVKLNPYADIHKADLFVLSSLYEGFATVINESLIAQTPVLATKVAGVDEQIVLEHHGYIVENAQTALNEAYVKALNKDRLTQMKQQLQGYGYPNEEILSQFNEVFLK